MISKDDFWSSVLAAGGIGELSTGDAVFDRRARCVWRVLESTLVAAEDVAQVECWEDVLELVPGAGLGLVERKAAVLRVLCEELPFTVALLPGRLRQLLGEGNFTVTQGDDRVTVAISYAAMESQRDAVDALLGCVLPRNLVTEIDPFPLDYTRIEYLESSGAQYIYLDGELTSTAAWSFSFTPTKIYTNNYFCGRNENAYAFAKIDNGLVAMGHVPNKNPVGFEPSTQEVYTVNFDMLNKRGCISCRDEKKEWIFPGIPATKALVFFGGQMTSENASTDVNYKSHAKMWDIAVSHNGEKTHEFVPALDSTGAPCMFDTVTRKPFYNFGTGDFDYPGKEEEPTTYSLRKPRMYAQYTEHGIRRLYHVPKGYNGSKEEYAAEHEFKILVETPMPEVGTWAPVWHEREDCIELEWVEVDSPAGGDS